MILNTSLTLVFSLTFMNRSAVKLVCLFQCFTFFLFRSILHLSAVKTSFVREFTDSIENVSGADFEATGYCVSQLIIHEWNVLRLNLLVC